MTNIMVVSCCCNDIRRIESPTVPQQQNENKPNTDLVKNKSEQILSIYELFSDECDLDDPDCAEGSSVTKTRNASCKSGGKSLKVLTRTQSIAKSERKDEIVDKNKTETNKVSKPNVLEDGQNDSKRQRNTENHNPSSIPRRVGRQRGYHFFPNNFDISFKSYSHLNGLLGIAIIVGISALTLAFTCWPQHNVILYPEYWYESIIPTNLILSFCNVSTIITYARMILKAQDILTLRVFWVYYFLAVMANVVIFVSIYCFWVKYLDLPHPMPLTGSVVALLMALLVIPVTNWFIFPREMKTKQNPFRKKILSWSILGRLRLLMTLAYGFVLSLPLVKNEDLQLGLGLLFPTLEAFNLWWNNKFSAWAFDCDGETAAIESLIAVQTTHSFSLTIALGSSHINKWTTYILIFADTCVNGWSVKNIISNHRIGTENANTNKNNSLKLLALKEFLEILVPTVYCLSYTGSYMGPNYEIIGGMGSNLWHHERISSLYEKLEEISIFVIAESLRGVGFAVLLWKYFDLNMYSAYCDVIKNYGLYILVVGATINISVSNFHRILF